MIGQLIEAGVNIFRLNMSHAPHDWVRRVYADILTPDFSLLCQSVGLAHRRVSNISDFGAALDSALAKPGPSLIEIDMVTIGPFNQSFAGPPAGAAGSS